MLSAIPIANGTTCATRSSICDADLQEFSSASRVDHRGLDGFANSDGDDHALMAAPSSSSNTRRRSSLLWPEKCTTWGP